MAPELLSEEEIEERLEEIEDWEWVDDSIERSIEFESFMDAIDFINRIANHAEEADHHPEIFNVYNTVELSLTTHDSGGLTHKDFDLAAKIDLEV
ncbi:4a-hydroxytetrahydrobiopterin dehydratase [Persicimonas caeni]|jgi:4a-hydroxytetrahydrobiopterin dehydratase|uniref:Putative pterin-4-alpha-carbinolamine dehydratase n=1 Tax=Persicimonas caeni TaxID=2292766 RepID=A0A4Y6PZK1_PERCE|nr:4a-hydroxytetrahydrobiopterin dehydratase [Persicimonas caeni]QDG53756.1 4a-hydroxytetrahydrobiopterin dehydratase [Persicimonas caeni]QED34977.1 4a-hydroxytetrahydrobiopterin dehydratase [Persicimonas caeni]